MIEFVHHSHLAAGKTFEFRHHVLNARLERRPSKQRKPLPQRPSIKHYMLQLIRGIDTINHPRCILRLREVRHSTTPPGLLRNPISSPLIGPRRGVDNDVHALPPTSRAQRVLPTSSLSREQITSSNSADQYAFLRRRKKGAGGPEATAMLPLPGIWECRFCWFFYVRSCWGLYIGSLILDCVAASPGTACVLHLLYQLEASPRICLGL